MPDSDYRYFSHTKTKVEQQPQRSPVHRKNNVQWYPSALLDIFVHKSLVEFVSKAVVDEGGLLLVGFSAAAILEDNIVVPTALDPHVGLGRFRVLLL